MYAPIPERGELWRHAEVARDLGSPFVAAVLEAGQRQLHRAPRTAALIRDWPGDPLRDAVAVRFNAGLHAIARRGSSPALSALYAGQHDDFDGAIGEALAAHDQLMATSMHDTPQTNEVGRSGAIAAALMEASREFGLPFELLEIGSSCGLNLNLGLYAFELGGIVAGDAGSPVRVAPSWRGEALVRAPLTIASARGTDLNPLRADDMATRDRLLSYIWADQPQRADRLEQALALAQRHPPQVDRGDACTWLAARLDEPQRAGICRVVVHSMVLQYLPQAQRDAIAAMLAQAGSDATIDRPLARISFEWNTMRRQVQLLLTCWPSGQERLLATCHAYGDWLDWSPGAHA
ncbi:DUF2332 family protein [Sphingomonas sp. S1-29]|uniref:DUF2332 domain-containing protein n=1 Tax=Sphingomonas sp. S1-29 TaxID=2991074 RepID=UPI00223F525D|nr:DUF2332 family protein [Sphingomonas sp. S1-29]UZK69213.1 DUF2332 family protein [Sphingomonas sp. S1-29]